MKQITQIVLEGESPTKVKNNEKKLLITRLIPNAVA